MNRYLDLHLGRGILIEPKGSITRLVRMLLFIHILIVLFQIPFRAIVLDTTYIRDFLLFAIVFLLLSTVAISGSLNIKRRYFLLDKIFFAYLLFGIVLIIFWLASGVSLISAFREFRNFFFPFVLFFVAKKTLFSSHHRVKIANIFFLIAFTFLLTSFVEYLLIEVIGYSPYIFPWYRYTFLTSYRFYGNLAGKGIGYIIPEDTAVLGLLGWQHATAATIMVLFAFSYPYLFNKIRKNHYISSSLWIIRFPNWISYSIVFLTGAAILLIFQVKTHMISYFFLILFVPLFIKGENLRKSILITFFIIAIVLSNNSIQSIIIGKFIEGFIGNENMDSTLIAILPENPISSLINRSIVNIFLGDWNFYYTGEIRILSFTAKFGIVWLSLFLGMFIVGFFNARKIIFNPFVSPSDRLFAAGTIGLLCICFIDMGHYARPLYAPIIDIFSVCLGALAAIYSDFSKIRK